MSNPKETKPDPKSAVPTPATAQIKPISHLISTEKMTEDAEKRNSRQTMRKWRNRR